MIGLRYSWTGQTLAPPMMERFAAALGVGRSQRAGFCTIAGALLSAPVTARRISAGWVPARMPRGDAVLLLGHIDNREELRRAFPPALGPARTDAELYALYYAAFGEACDLKLIGQYATIVWSPEDRSVRLARSPIHAPALHIWHDRDRLIVASLSQAIFATGEVRCAIDEQKIADTLFLNYHEAERGWFKGIQRLPLGARCRIDATGIATTRYYDPATLPQIRYARDRDYVEAADALFGRATRAAIAGFSRPAVSLSGGYDSQAVAAYAAEVMGPDKRLLGLTAVPEEGWDGQIVAGRFGDERAHAAALARMYPAIELETVDSAGLSFDHKLPALFLMMGAPPRNAMNLHWIHELRARARAHGCDVLLTGGMGNATLSFDGNGALPSLLRQGRFLKLAWELNLSRSHRGSSLRAMLAKAVMPLLPDTAWRACQRCRRGQEAGEFPLWCGMNPDWAREMRVFERARALGFDAVFRAKHNSRATRLAIIAGSGEAGDISQAMEAISGIPKRDPTSYRPFFEFCFGIPDDQFLHNGQRRWLAKRLLKGKIPDLVLDESRRGLQAADWHLRLGRERHQLQAEIERLAGDPAMAARFDLPRLRAALEAWPAATPVTDAA